MAATNTSVMVANVTHFAVVVSQVINDVTQVFARPDDENHGLTDGISDHNQSSFIPWNNPDNVITEKQRDWGLSTIDCALMPPVVLFGLVGNIITLLVFIRQGVIMDSTNICLFALAISDTLFVITTAVRKLSCLVSTVDELTGKNWAALLYPQGYFISLYFGRVTSVITMIIAVERSVAVLRPMMVGVWLSSARMRHCMVWTFVLVAMLVAPMFCVYTTRWETSSATNRTVIMLETTWIFKAHHQAFECYHDIGISILLRQIPCIIVALSTISIIISLRRYNKFRIEAVSSTGKMSGPERKVTRMLVVISCLYVLCLTPGNAIMIVRHVLTDIRVGRKNHNLAVLLSEVTMLTEVINSSFNFVIYMLMSGKFLFTVKMMFGFLKQSRKRSRRRSTIISIYTTSSSGFTGNMQSKDVIK